jgi:hypothetical protein
MPDSNFRYTVPLKSSDIVESRFFNNLDQDQSINKTLSPFRPEVHFLETQNLINLTFDMFESRTNSGR